MASPTPISSLLSCDPKRINVVLFSQPDCEFCAEVRDHYLRPLIAVNDRAIAVAEAGVIDGAPMRDWQGKPTTQRDFAAAAGVRFAPTVAFYNSDGAALAEPIVGLSRDYFGAYLEQRLATARQALRSPATR